MNTDNLLDIATNICLDSLSDEEILWYKFASKLGFDYHYLHKIVKNKESNNEYKIMGLIWKYSKINISDSNNVIDNELKVHLKFYKKEEKPKVVETKNIKEDDDIKCQYVPITPNSFDSNLFSVSRASTLFDTCSSINPFELNKPQLNEKMKEYDGIFLSLNEFVTQYDVENIIKEKKDYLKLKYSVGVLWT